MDIRLVEGEKQLITKSAHTRRLWRRLELWRRLSLLRLHCAIARLFGRVVLLRQHFDLGDLRDWNDVVVCRACAQNQVGVARVDGAEEGLGEGIGDLNSVTSKRIVPSFALPSTYRAST